MSPGPTGRTNHPQEEKPHMDPVFTWKGGIQEGKGGGGWGSEGSEKGRRRSWARIFLHDNPIISLLKSEWGSGENDENIGARGMTRATSRKPKRAGKS